MDAVRLGLAIRALRRRPPWTQAHLAERVGLSASEISRIERGAAHQVSIRTLERILEALGARLYLRVVWRGEELDRLLDRDHALGPICQGIADQRQPGANLSENRGGAELGSA